MNDQTQIITQLLERISVDSRLKSMDISMYISFLILWYKNDFKSPFKITRKQIMNLSKIKSISSYHRVINSLMTYDYILYEPTFDSRLGSTVALIFEDSLLLNDRIISNQLTFTIPNVFEVNLFFEECNCSLIQATEFYNYYHEKNWKLNDQKSMKCWQSAARKWIYKYNQFSKI